MGSIERACQTEPIETPVRKGILRKFAQRSLSRTPTLSSTPLSTHRRHSSTGPTHHRRKSHQCVNTVSTFYLVHIFLSTPLLFSMPGCVDRRQFLLKSPIKTLHQMGFTTEELFQFKDYQAIQGCKDVMLQLIAQP
ncbi:hypothetical protein Ddc_04809 [Ditylenchus destructor]|nr:hypothetical protein Ddc_04809 [Ditylenchus destructor]